MRVVKIVNWEGSKAAKNGAFKDFRVQYLQHGIEEAEKKPILVFYFHLPLFIYFFHYRNSTVIIGNILLLLKLYYS